MSRCNENVSCNSVERLLIKRSFNELTEEEELILHGHLESCDVCRSYQYTLSNLHKTVQSDSEHCPVPDSTIHQNLVHEMKTMKVNKEKQSGTIWRWARNVLEFRIPVYQTLAGIVLILLMVFILSQYSFLNNRGDEGLSDLTHFETQLLETINVMNDLELIEQQKIGRSAKEDSTLMQFIFEAM